MLKLRSPSDLHLVCDPVLRQLIAERFAELAEIGEGYEWAELGHFVLVESSDSISALEGEVLCPLAASIMGEAKFNEPGFVPGHELAEDYGAAFVLVYVQSSGYGIGLVIPKGSPVAYPLLDICHQYATKP